MSLNDEIFQIIAANPIPNFFITVEFARIGEEIPTGIDVFLKEKHQTILQGVTGRKFIFQEKNWRLIFTFFPTDRVVDERYALKNKVQMKKHIL